MATLEELEVLLTTILAEVRTAQQQKVAPSQISVPSGISEINSNLGSMRAGEFMALSSGNRPGDANANGTFMSATGEVISGHLVRIAEVKNGTLQAGFGEGAMIAGEGDVIADENGIFLKSSTFVPGGTNNLWMGLSVASILATMGSDRLLTMIPGNVLSTDTVRIILQRTQAAYPGLLLQSGTLNGAYDRSMDKAILGFPIYMPNEDDLVLRSLRPYSTGWWDTDHNNVLRRLAFADELAAPRSAMKFAPELQVFASGGASVAYTLSNSASQVQCGFYASVTAANANNGDRYAVSMLLEGGTYTFLVHGVRTTSCGIFDLYVDGVMASAGHDAYNSSTDYDYEWTISNIVVVGSGKHKIELVLNGTNGTDYRLDITYISAKQASF